MYSRITTIKLAKPARPWKIAADMERVLEASIGPAWAKMTKRIEASTPSFTTFSEPDLVTLQETVEDYRGPIRDITIATNDEAFVHCSVRLDAEQRAESISLHTLLMNRVDAERLDYALAENVGTLSRRESSPWHGSKIVRGSLTQHVNAKAADKAEAPPIIRARSLRVRFRRWMVLNRDGIIISLATGLVGSVAIIVLQLVGVIPVPA